MNQPEDDIMNPIIIDDDDEVVGTRAQSEQINDLRGQLRKRAADYRQEKKNHDQTAKQLETAQWELQKLQRDSRNAEASSSSNSTPRDREKLDTELEQFRIQLSVAEDNFQKASTEVAQLRDTLTQAVYAENALNAEIENLKAELESRSASGDGNSRIQKLSEEVMSMKMSEANLTTELIDARQQLQQREDGNYNLAVQLENIKTELETSHKKLGILEMENTVFHNQAKVDKLEIQRLNKDTSFTKLEVDRLKKEGSLDKLEIDRLKDAKIQHQKHICLIVANEAELQDKVDKFAQKWEEAEQILQHRTTMLNKTSDELTQADKKIKKLKRKISKLKDDAKKKRKRDHVNKAAVDELKKKNKKFSQELEAAKESEKQVENLKKQIAVLSNNYEKNEKIITDLRNNLKQFQKLKLEMGGQLEKCSAELVEVRRLLKEAEQTLNDERTLRCDAENQKKDTDTLWKRRLTDIKALREKEQSESKINLRNAQKLLSEERNRNKQLQEELKTSMSEFEILKREQVESEAKIREFSEAKSETKDKNANVRAEYENKVSELSKQNATLAEKIKENEVIHLAKVREIEEKLESAANKNGENVKLVSDLEAKLEEARGKEREWEDTKRKMMDAALKASQKVLEESFSKESSSQNRKRPSDTSGTDQNENRKRRCKSTVSDWPVVSVKRSTRTQDSIQISLPEGEYACPIRDALLTPDSTSNYENCK